jgi:hypothetical protein
MSQVDVVDIVRKQARQNAQARLRDARDYLQSMDDQVEAAQRQLSIIETRRADARLGLEAARMTAEALQ